MKKILLFILTYLLFIEGVHATKLVSLGDSIPNGYLLEDNDKSYDNELASKLNLKFYEYSYIGMTTADLKGILSNNTSVINEVKKADVIILCIGSNDLLDLTDNFELNSMNIDKYNMATISFDNGNIIDSINSLNDLVTEDLKNEVSNIYSNFKINYKDIIERIKQLNPDALIYVNNIYNPYKDVKVPLEGVDLSLLFDYLDGTIIKFNDYINELSSTLDFNVLDVYNTLNKSKYLNISVIKRTMDPHPNIKGHEQLLNLYLNNIAYKVTYEDNIYYVLKGDKLKIDPPLKNGYTFVRWNHDLNKIDSDIKIKPIYKKKINIAYIYIPALVALIIVSLFIIKRKKGSN